MTSRRQLVLATRNRHKVRELSRILEAADLRIDLVSLEEFPGVPDVAETELTFEGNALLKARAVSQATGLPAVADDSGLCVEAMAGMPGVLSARWSGRHGNDRANLELLLGQLEEFPDTFRKASFVCAAALVLPDGRGEVAEGEVTGRVIREPRGLNGFGYDPIFVPDGETRTTAEMSADEKDAISHRGRAFRALVPAIRRMLEP